MRLNYVRAKIQNISLSLALTLSMVGCATTRPRHVWTEQALNAETLQYEGKWDDARGAYQELLPHAPTQDKRRWISLKAALLEVEVGNEALGKEKLAELYEADVYDEHGANAMYEVAKLLDDEDRTAARKMRLRTIERYPRQIAAEFALQDIVNEQIALQSADSARDLAALLRDLYTDAAGTELGDNILFALAQVQDRQLGTPDSALESYRTLYREYRDGPLADDALWELAAIYRRHQRWEPAIDALMILANDRESSWFIGSYDSAWVDDAIFELGLIHLLYLDDYDRAVQWFERYSTEFGTGMLADDAAWHIVQAHRLSGDEDAHHRSLRAFLEGFPESRHVDEARDRLGGTNDPG